MVFGRQCNGFLLQCVFGVSARERFGFLMQLHFPVLHPQTVHKSHDYISSINPNLNIDDSFD